VRLIDDGKDGVMAKVVVTNHLTLDGVMQSPGGREEDPRGGFAFGGWAAINQDSVMAEVMGRGMASGGALLFGRWTYEKMYEVWHGRTDGNPFTEVLDNRTKYVASETLTEPLPWQNSVLLAGDVCDAVAQLKGTQSGHLSILGSGKLIATLMTRNLVDQWVLPIHPVVLGGGRRLFADGVAPQSLRLVDSTVTTKGVIVATYETIGGSSPHV
jgi:dihydrofolate reductase